MKRRILRPTLLITIFAAVISCSPTVGSGDKQSDSKDTDDQKPATEIPETVTETVPAADAVINISAIPGIVVPVRSAIPVTTQIETAQYSGTVSWAPGDNPFAAQTVYTANITLTAKSGYTLTGITVNFFTVAGAAATNDASSGIVKAIFPATGKTPDVDVAFLFVTQETGASYTADTIALTLSFDVDPASLTAGDITVTGATKGTLTGTGLTRTLAISDITVANGAAVSVTVTCPEGFAISGSPRTAPVYREIALGRQYLGGVIEYILQSDDDGYNGSVPHGLILSNEDLHTYSRWSLTANYDKRIGTTGMAIGTGRANTEAIIAQNGIGEYSAYLTSVYEGGGFTDWYLPSADELAAIRRNVYLVPSCYHSSSEADASNAYVVWNDIAVLGEGKYGGRYVRAVRDF